MGKIVEKNQPCLDQVKCKSHDATNMVDLGISNKEKTNGITKDFLQKHFYYEDGSLFWKAPINNMSRIIEGGRAGTLDKSSNYFRLDLLCIKYQLHRLIWIFHNGDIPDYITIDHIDINTHNNRIENLRLATRSLQRVNSTLRSDSTTREKGISWHSQSGKFTLSLTIDGKRMYLGRYKTVEEAVLERAKYSV